MEKQVLSVEQMQELIDLGIDTSKAFIYIAKSCHAETFMFRTDFHSEEVPKSHGYVDFIPTFTLQDILEILPERVTYRGDVYILCILRHTGISYRKAVDIETIKISLESTSLLEAAFNMLKWCKQNNHI